MALDRENVLKTLEQLYDPEISVDIVNLGLIYEVKVDGGRVNIKMTTTAAGCPVGNWIAGEAEKVVGRMGGVDEVHVELVYDPPWNIEMVTDAGRKMLGWT